MFEKNQKTIVTNTRFLSSTSHTSLQAYGYSSKMQRSQEGLYEISNFKNGQLTDKQTFSTLTFATAHLKFCDRLNDFLNERYFNTLIVTSSLESNFTLVGASCQSYWSVKVDGNSQLLGSNSQALDSERLFSFILYVAKLALIKKVSRFMKKLLTVAEAIWNGQKIKSTRSY